MNSRAALLAIGSIVGYFSLLVGVVGQACFLTPVVKLYLPAFIAVLIFMLPFLIVYTITFTRQSFLPPRKFGLCLLFAMCWFATITIVAEILYHLGCMPPDSPQNATTMGRVLMHVGWLSSLYLIPRYIATRRYESKRDA
jgi:hypothetical protein